MLNLYKEMGELYLGKRTRVYRPFSILLLPSVQSKHKAIAYYKHSGYRALLESHVYNLSKKSASGGPSYSRDPYNGAGCIFHRFFSSLPRKNREPASFLLLYNSFRSIINGSQDDGVMPTVNTITVQKLRPRRQLTELRGVNN